MRPTELEDEVFDRWGRECVVCGRKPEEWLETNLGNRVQDKLSLHHVNGDDSDNRVENIIPLCQSCHVHIHKVDKPPYRKWHRQLPMEHRNAWNSNYKEYYEGPRLTREEAERRFGDEGGIPESVKYLKHEREDFDPSQFEPADTTDDHTTPNDGETESTTDSDAQTDNPDKENKDEDEENEENNDEDNDTTA